MAIDNRKNFAKGTVSTGYDAAAVSIVLTSGHGTRFPAVPFNATWWNSTDYADPCDDPNVEVVRVTALSTDTLTITRAQESTSASTKNTSSKTYSFIAGMTAGMVASIDALFPTTGTISNSTGDSTITPSTSNALSEVTFTGAARTSKLILDITGRSNGDRVLVALVLPATSGIVIEFRNGTSGGTILLPASSFPSQQFATDGVVLTAVFEFYIKSGVWTYLRASIPA